MSFLVQNAGASHNPLEDPINPIWNVAVWSCLALILPSYHPTAHPMSDALASDARTDARLDELDRHIHSIHDAQGGEKKFNAVSKCSFLLCVVLG